MQRTVKRPFYIMPRAVKGPHKFMATISITAFLFSGALHTWKYGKYQFAKETVAHREALLKNLEGKQEQEGMIKGVLANRDMWAAKVERYERTGASKLYHFVEKIMK